MNNQDAAGAEKILYVLVGAIIVLAALVGIGALVNRRHCGEWASPDSPGQVFGFFTGDQMAAFGTTGSGCAAPLWEFWVSVAVFFFTIGIIVAVIWVAWMRYKQSDRYLVRTLRERDGIARAPEVNKAVGPKAALKAVKKVRPTLKSQPADKSKNLPRGKKRVKDPTEANLRLGKSQGVTVYSSLEESAILLGPPRSGKGVGILVGAIIDAPGPVITTSSRADNLAMTMHKRQEKGPVAVFDPQGLTGQKTNFKWSPMAGCKEPLVANQRATSLIQATGLAPGSNNEEWAAMATTIMECLLHAAALGDPDTGRAGTIDDLQSWGNTEAEAKTAVAWLKGHETSGRAAFGWGTTLEGLINQDSKMRGNMWFGVRNAVKGLSVPNVRAALQPESQAETFDIDNFLENNGTLYIVGTKTGGSSAGPFLIAMMDAITEHARQKAAKKTGNRLDPPMTLILDEIANIATAWPGLRTLMADGGGVGISPFPVFQSLAQVKQEWGESAADALWEAATIKLQLGGAADTKTLDVIQKLAGTYEHRRDVKSRGQGGGSVQPQYSDKNVLEQAEIRRMPTIGSPAGPHALMFFRNRRPFLVKVRPFFKRKDAKEIEENKKKYYKDNNISEETHRVIGWESDPVNKEQPVAVPQHHVSESPEETRQRLEQANQRAEQERARAAENSPSPAGFSGPARTPEPAQTDEHTPGVTEEETISADTSMTGIKWG